MQQFAPNLEIMDALNVLKTTYFYFMTQFNFLPK